MRGILIIYFVGINLVTFLLYGVDKWKACKGRWRIPAILSPLAILSVLMGCHAF